ncbi:unnamed protein product [Peniophora sp. CBMAI 1063]|nr:unnamed protein product [Peniophora sp. CBMAI 1063]
MQTIIRQRLDMSLVEFLQHRWMHNGQNIKPEIQWSQLRAQWAPGFEAVLQNGLDNGLLDMNEDLEQMLFRRLAIPWLQDELDRWVDQKNSTARRANKYKVLPHGIPDLIFDSPEDYGATDFKIPVSPELFGEMRAKFCPPDRAVVVKILTIWWL